MPIQGQNVLVVGGTSGLGFQLACALGPANNVIVAGHINRENLKFRFLELHGNFLSDTLDRFVIDLPYINLLIYAAGSYERGLLGEMDDQQIINMVQIYFLAPALLLARILRRQNSLPGFIGISSVSQWRPKSVEPVYASLKAGFGMLARCLALDPGIGKVLVVAPARVNKNGTGGAREGEDGKLDPAWVVGNILAAYEGDFKYGILKITQDPAKIKIEKGGRIR